MLWRKQKDVLLPEKGQYAWRQKGLRDELPRGEKQDPTEEFSLMHVKSDLNVSTSRKTGAKRGMDCLGGSVEKCWEVSESKRCKAVGKDRWVDGRR